MIDNNPEWKAFVAKVGEELETLVLANMDHATMCGNHVPMEACSRTKHVEEAAEWLAKRRHING